MRKRLVCGVILALVVCSRLGAEITTPGTPVFISTLTVPSSTDIGGLSGLDTNATGTRFIAVGDRGDLVFGSIERDEINNPIGLNITESTKLLGPNGLPLPRPDTDAEGVVLGDKGFFVSYEQTQRVCHYSSAEASAKCLPQHADFTHFIDNRGLEALTRDEQGRLIAIHEELENGVYHVYRFQDGDWTQAYTLPGDNDYKAVGGDYGPDGKLYLLERKFLGILGFQSRVRRFELGEAEVLSVATVLETSLARHDNLEGLSVWRDDQNGIRLTMVSDDNFFPFHRSELVEYRLSTP